MINSVTARTSVTASGADTSTDFATPAPIYTKNDVEVYVDGVKKTVDSQYTVTRDTTDNTADVNFTSGNVPADSAVVVIVRSLAYKQEQDFINNDALDIENVETGLDKLTIMSQQLSDGKDYSFKFAKELPASEFNSDTIVGTNFANVQDRATTVTTGKTDRAYKVLSFKSNGDLEAAHTIGTFRGSDATTTTADYGVRDLVKSTTAGQLDNVYICIKTSPSGTALTNTTYWTLIVDAYSAASASQTATTKAGEASTSASNAALSESNASTSESNALSYKDSAESAQTAAESAQALAEDYKQSAFDYQYLKLTSNLTIGASQLYTTAYKLDLNGQTLVNNGTLVCATFIEGTGTITGSGGIVQTGPVNLTQDEFAELNDISLSTPADSDFLVHNGSYWVNESGSTARTSLGVAIGTDVQAYDAQLTDVAGLTPTDGNFIVGDGTNFVTESGATARTSLGVDAAGTDNSTNVSLEGSYDYFTINGQVITRGQINLTTDVTGDLPVAEGGTGSSTASGARTNLGVDASGTDNSTDVTLTGTPDYITISGQVITRNQVDLTSDVTGDLPIAEGGTGSSTASGARTNLGVAVGSDVQAYDADLTAIAGLTSASDKGIQFTGSGTAGTYDLTSAGKALLDDADASAQRTTLGLGTIATVDAPTGTVVGTSDSQTLTNKTLTSVVLDTGVSGTAVLDEDNMASDSATQLATQQSIKAYVDTLEEVISLPTNLTIDAGEVFCIPHRFDLNGKTFTNNGTLNCKDLVTGTGTITGSSGTIQFDIELGNVPDESRMTMFNSSFLTISRDNATDRNITITGL